MGLSVGNPHYMSPEQATGDRDVDPRTDIYALGCVLYEMLVGEPPYTGPTAQAVLGEIITGKPVSVVEKRASIPPNVDAVSRKALEKLPADRFTGAQEFATALEDSDFRHGEEAETGVAVGRSQWNLLSMGLGALAVVLALALGWSLLRPEPPAPLARFSSPFEEGQLPTGMMEFTDDGSLVYVGPEDSGQGSQLWVRRWADLEATPVRGTEGVVSFALSPDGREVAFSADRGPLRVVLLEGGPIRTLVEDARLVSDWTPDGTVYFMRIPALAVGSVPAVGGGAEAV